LIYVSSFISISTSSSIDFKLPFKSTTNYIKNHSIKMAAQQGTKLDQSLDQIMKDAGSTRGGRAGRRRGGARRAHKAVAAPVGGIAKAPRGPKAPAKTAAPVVRRDSKIVVSNLVRHVDTHQL
jgi:hypothetical protein